MQNFKWAPKPQSLRVAPHAPDAARPHEFPLTSLFLRQTNTAIGGFQGGHGISCNTSVPHLKCVALH